jgi:hypothetical protein
MRSDLTRRTKALEVARHTDVDSDEAAKTRAFLDRLTVDELRQSIAISERTHDGDLPMTDEERAFWDSLVTKYS